MSKISITIADSSFLIRNGIDSLLKTQNDVIIEKSIESKEKIIEKINKNKPDILIINPELCNSNSTDLKKDFHENKNMKVILLSTYKLSPESYNADAAICFHDSRSTILEKIRIVKDSINIKNISKKDKKNDPISSREKKILQQIALGLTNKEIADKLFISIHTVVTHRKNITHKLGIKSVSGLTVYAILHNLIVMEDVNKI